MSRIRVNSIKPISGASVSVSGSLVVTGNVTAEEFVTERVSTSIIFKSGSTKFGDTADDRHEFTGTLELTGSALISSTLGVGGIADLETYVNVATASIATLDGHVGQIHLITASHDTRITTAEGEIDQLQDSVYNLQLNTGSQQTQIDTNAGNISTLQTELNTAESHIENLHAFTGSLDDTYATDAELAAVSGALAISIDTSVAGLNAASSSYALASDLIIATASIAANETTIGVLNGATSSYALSASLSTDYININQLKAISSGSADFAAFQAAIALL